MRKWCSVGPVLIGALKNDRGDSADLMNLVRHELGLSAKARCFPLKGTCPAIYSAALNTGLPGGKYCGLPFPRCRDWTVELKLLFLANQRPLLRRRLLHPKAA